MRLPLPEQLVAQARAYADGTAEPAAPRNAATVVLMRPFAGSSAGPSVYLLRRQTSMASGHRVWNLHPGGGFSGDGRSPFSRTRWCWPGRSTSGITSRGIRLSTRAASTRTARIGSVNSGANRR